MQKTQFRHTEARKNPDGPLRVDSIKIFWEDDRHADTSYLTQDYAGEEPAEAAKYREQDKKRLASFARGTWKMVGCYAVAICSYPIGGGCRTIQEFQSGGLWGIESDSGKRYLRTVEVEQVSELIQHLKRFNVPTENVPTLAKIGRVEIFQD